MAFWLRFNGEDRKMKPFKEIYQIVEESSHEAAFNEAECEAMYNVLNRLQIGADVVEIGLQFGRSTTVIAEVAKYKGFNFTAIDFWVEGESPEAKAHLLSQKEKHGWNFNLVDADSGPLGKAWKEPIYFIHIDGNHTYEGVKADCEGWLDKVTVGGYALFDDYGHDSLPGVYKAVTEYMDVRPGWEFQGRYGNKLGIFRQLA